MSTTLDASEARRLLLERRLRGGAGGPRPAAERIRPRPAGAAVPLSVEQRHVWLHASLVPDLPLYNEPITIHRRGPFDVDAFRRGFDEVLRRHEAWRTSFALVDGEVMQVVHDAVRVALPLVDLSALPPAEREREAARIGNADARVPLAMDEAPLIRGKVLRMSAEEHRVQLVVHHVIFDGVSIYRVLLPELAALYAAFAAGREPALPMPELQYGDYAVWRARQVDGEETARQLAYWRRELAGELPVLRLPTDRPRPAVESHRGAMEVFPFPPGLTGAIKALSRAENVTPYMTMLAAFKAMLFRYGGQEDVVVGGVTDARRRPELEGLIGYFLNAIALRTRPTGDLPFRDYLRQVRDAALGALGASDVPFGRVVRELNVPRDPSCHPVFQAFFSIQPPVEQRDEGWDITQMDVGSGTAKFDLYLEMEDRPEGMLGRFLYNTDLFDLPTVRRMIGHWLTMLRGATDEPGRALGRLPLLTGEELRQQREDWNDTALPVPTTTLHALVAGQALRDPGAPAVACGERRWSRGELGRCAEALAARLRGAGAGPGALVAVSLDRSPEMVAALLAVLKVGAAFLPLDAALPRTRLASYLDDARPAVLLTQRALLPRLPGTGDLPVLLLDDAPADAAGEVAGGWPEVDPEAPAYVLYTSGSTGKPKAVEVPHRAVVNHLVSVRDITGFAASDSLFAVTTLAFDIAILEIFLPLVGGGQVVLASREVSTDPALLAEAVGRSGCTVMQATPATWRGLVEAGWAGVPGMRLLCGGEPMTRDLADALLSRGMRLRNMYGPTETTIWSTTHEVARGEVGSVPIGRPIGNTTVFVLDPGGEPVPVGVVGELFIGGTGVALGYRGRPDLTRERFVGRDAAPGQRLYRTGDLARWRADGLLECLGRADNQVKVRGFRVELEEVEAALAGHPQLAAAAVRAWADPSGVTSLAAYLVPREGAAAPDAAEVRLFLRDKLPDYMVPTRVEAIGALPLTANRKLDRKALPEPRREAARLDEAPAGPRDGHEARLAAIWESVLGMEGVGVHDDFFDLGGHSILVAKLQARIRSEFGQHLSIASLFGAPTVARMAAVLRDAERGVGTPRAPRVVAVQPGGARPPLFWVEPTPSFRKVAEALGPDQPFLGLTLDAQDVAELGGTADLPAIAARLVRALLDHQPRGPYRLGGLCNMGILAFEVATQLRAAGHEVAGLVLLDAQNPSLYRKFGPPMVELSKLRFHARRTANMTARARWDYVLWQLRRLHYRLTHRPSASERAPGAIEVVAQAALRYMPRPYGGRVFLLQAAERPGRIDFRPGWALVVPGAFAALDVPGDHSTLLQPWNIAGLAARIGECLAAVSRDAL